MKPTILLLSLLLCSCSTAPKPADPIDTAMAAFALSILTEPAPQQGGGL